MAYKNLNKQHFKVCGTMIINSLSEKLLVKLGAGATDPSVECYEKRLDIELVIEWLMCVLY